MGLVALWHVGSSQIRTQTCVPCIGRRILNHCATREVPKLVNLNFDWKYLYELRCMFLLLKTMYFLALSTKIVINNDQLSSNEHP